jgi:hypothetical protein
MFVFGLQFLMEMWICNTLHVHALSPEIQKMAHSSEKNYFSPVTKNRWGPTGLWMQSTNFSLLMMRLFSFKFIFLLAHYYWDDHITVVFIFSLHIKYSHSRFILSICVFLTQGRPLYLLATHLICLPCKREISTPELTDWDCSAP